MMTLCEGRRQCGTHAWGIKLGREWCQGSTIDLYTGGEWPRLMRSVLPPIEARGAFEPGREDDRIRGQEPHPATFATMLDLLGDYRASFS
jgi:hypothetical protein